MKKRSIVLRGDPELNEYGAAGEVIHPGYLVKGVTTVLKATATGKVPRALALEREELGQGIDNSRQGSGTSTAYYASGDVVKIGVFDSGDEAVVFIASGVTCNEDTLLGSAGDGTFNVQAAAAAIARGMENLGTVLAETAVRVQFI
jgi:hypothetical protein